MKIVWNRVVKMTPIRLPMSPWNWAGASGVGTGVALGATVGAALAPEASGDPPPTSGGEQAATRNANRTTRASPRTIHAAPRSRGSPRMDGRRRCGRSANRVVASGIAGVAAGDPAGAHDAAPEEPVAFDRLLGVAGAGRLVAAAGRQPGERKAIGMDQRDPEPLHESPPATTPPRVSSRRSVCVISGRSEPRIAGLAITSTSQPGRSDGPIDLNASRSRRRTLLRMTAEPSVRPVASPNRVDPSSVRRTRVARSGWDRYAPRS